MNTLFAVLHALTLTAIIIGVLFLASKINHIAFKIMSKISEYSAAVDTAFATISANIDVVVTAQAGITEDVASLKAIIEQLQNNPGPISAEDQALLDSGVEKINALSAKLQPVADALKALDESTPPPAPPV